MIFWTCEKIGGHVNLTWSHVRRTCRIFSLFLSLLSTDEFGASIVVFGGLEAFEKIIGVPLDVTARINYLSIQMWNLIRILI